MSNWYRAKDVKRTGKIGTVYLLHFARPFAHCNHYIGFTERTIETRVKEHWTGNGAALTSACHDLDIPMVLARVWENVDQGLEFLLKCRAGSPKLCPICNPNAGNLAKYPEWSE